MKWVFEICEKPQDIRYPIIAHKIATSGSKKGPFYLSIDELSAVLRDIEHMENDFISLPFLPRNTIYMTHSKDMTKFKIILEYPKIVNSLHYQTNDNDRIDFVGFPRVLLHLNATKNGDVWKIDDTRIFAVEEGTELTPSTRLFYFPFPNVYKDGGEICWGGNSVPEFKHLYELNQVYSLFLSSPFSEDLGTRLFKHKRGTFLSYLDDLDGKKSKEFDDEELLPSEKKLSSLMGILINRTGG